MGIFYFYATLSDSKALLARESVLESVAEKHRKWNAFTQLVGAG